LGEPILRFLEPLVPLATAGEEAIAHPPAGLLLVISVIVAVAGVLGGWMMHRDRREPRLGAIGTFLEQRWHIDALYDRVIVRPARGLARWLAGFVDLGIIDAAVNGAGGAVAAFAKVIRRPQTGYARQYALAVLAGTVLILGYWLLRP
jgi:NADH-quinone oxidoreductase subunit L